MAGHSARLLASLERRMFVTPSLRKVVSALPDRPDPAGPQANAVVALVVMNAWMCLNEGALDLFKELDEATAGLHRFYPQDVSLKVDGPPAVEEARLAAEALVSRLGFSPGHRTKVAQVVHDCARAVLSQSSGVFQLRTVLGPGPRALLFEACVEPRPQRSDRVQLGSAPTLSPRRIERVADELSVDEEADGRVRLRALFYAVMPGAKA